MTASAPWQCPACDTWLAPHVAEHRCDPPGSVTVTPFAPSGTGGTSGALLPPGTTITVSGSVTSERDLISRIQDHMLARANRNWSGGLKLRGHAA